MTLKEIDKMKLRDKDCLLEIYHDLKQRYKLLVKERANILILQNLFNEIIQYELDFERLGVDYA